MMNEMPDEYLDDYPYEFRSDEELLGFLEIVYVFSVFMALAMGSVIIISFLMKL